MAAQIIDGKQVAADMRAELKDEVAKLKEQGIVPVSYTHLTLPTSDLV